MWKKRWYYPFSLLFQVKKVEGSIEGRYSAPPGGKIDFPVKCLFTYKSEYHQLICDTGAPPQMKMREFLFLPNMKYSSIINMYLRRTNSVVRCATE